jgi:small subunit ribosomal protein S1
MDQNAAQLGMGDKPETENNAYSNGDLENNMASLLAQEGVEIDFPQQGETRTGVVASISQGQILVSVGTKSEGVISGKEFDIIPQEELEKLQVGDEIPVYVLNPEDQNGNLVLSFVRALEESAWQNAEAMLESKETFASKVESYNKGGLIVPMGNLRGFVPASQISLTRRISLGNGTPEERWGKFVGEDIVVSVIEVDRERRRLILSERAASSETRETIKEKVIEELKEGDIKTGRVTSLADFGAFVNISGADGLVHLSEISWDRIANPNEVLKVGQEVKVKIISIDREKKRIGLSIRQLLEDPLVRKLEVYKKGMLVEGTITRLTKFGAFARLDDDIEGLIHISEISEKRIEHPKEVLNEGDVLTLRVIKVDPSNHRVGLSLRRVDSLAYADMDWQSLLDQELVGEEGQPPAAPAETEEAAIEPEAEEAAVEPETEEPAAEPEAEQAAEEEAPASDEQPAPAEDETAKEG